MVKLLFGKRHFYVCYKTLDDFLKKNEIRKRNVTKESSELTKNINIPVYSGISPIVFQCLLWCSHRQHQSLTVTRNNQNQHKLHLLSPNCFNNGINILTILPFTHCFNLKDCISLFYKPFRIQLMGKHRSHSKSINQSIFKQLIKKKI